MYGNSNIMKKDEYTFGQCKICKKDTALKNGVCKDCEATEMPDFIEQLFGDIEHTLFLI